MAGLGETQDVRELVPGDPDALQTTVSTLGRYAEILERASSGLNTIDDGGWQGAGAEAFHQAFGNEPSRWATASDSFTAARNALGRYATTLQWAQNQAAQAIALRLQADQTTAQAWTVHEQHQQRAAQDAAAAGLPPPVPVEFVDPGEQLRAAAHDRLAYAQAQLAQAGEEAAQVVDQAQQPAPQQPGRLARLFDAVRDILGDGVRSYGEFVGNRVRGIGEFVDAVYDRVGDTVNTVVTGAGDVVGTGFERLGDVTGFDPFGTAGGNVRNLTDELGNRVDRAYDHAGDAVADAADRAGQGIEDVYGTIATRIESDDDGDLGGDSQYPDDGSPDDGEGDNDGTDDDDTGDGEGDSGGDDGQQDQEQDDTEPDVDRNGHWENANGDKPDPEDISAQDRRAHILYGDGTGKDGGHRHGSGVPDKTTFPPDWDDDKIIDEVEDVAKNPDEPPVYDEEEDKWTVKGTRDGVEIVVIVYPDGEVETGYPTGGEGVHRNDKNGEPQPLE